MNCLYNLQSRTQLLEDWTDSMLSTGSDSDTGIGKSNLPCSNFISSLSVSDFTWRKDLGKEDSFLENDSKERLGVVWKPDCEDTSKRIRELCGEGDLGRVLRRTFREWRVMEVKGVGSTVGGGISALSVVTVPQTSALVEGGGGTTRIGGFYNCAGEGCPTEERVVVTIGVVEDRSLLQIGQSRWFFGGKGNSVISLLTLNLSPGLWD
jgi:hypothetical protein